MLDFLAWLFGGILSFIGWILGGILWLIWQVVVAIIGFLWWAISSLASLLWSFLWPVLAFLAILFGTVLIIRFLAATINSLFYGRSSTAGQQEQASGNNAYNGAYGQAHEQSYNDSRQEEGARSTPDGLPNPESASIEELLAFFGVASGGGRAEARKNRNRRIAEHHPDCFFGADPSVIQAHERQTIVVNRCWERLCGAMRW
jgi:membrane protein implicated in regulation of membrane protease activity